MVSSNLYVIFFVVFEIKLFEVDSPDENKTLSRDNQIYRKLKKKKKIGMLNCVVSFYWMKFHLCFFQP